MLKVGLTGGIGSGKSIVARIVEQMGYPVFYSDSCAKELMVSNSKVKNMLIDAFGESVYVNGELNKDHLSKLIFEDENNKIIINGIVHPEVRLSFEEFSETNKNCDLVFNEAAILFETGAYKTFDYTILVSAPEELRIDRVCKRDSISREDILKRIEAQWPEDQKIQLANFLINNDEVEPLLIQVETCVEKMLS